MDQSVSMMAIEPLTLQGRRVAVWETFTASPSDAAILVRRELAIIRPRRYQTRVVEPEPQIAPPIETTAPKPSKRRYRRRDMDAEPL